MNPLARKIILSVLVPGEYGPGRQAIGCNDADTNANNNFKTQDPDPADRLRKKPLIYPALYGSYKEVFQ